MESSIEQMDQVKRAIRHVLDRVQLDEDFRHHMMDTESHSQLMKAEALLTSTSELAVREERRKWLPKERRKARLTVSRERIEQLEKLLESKFISPPPWPSAIID